jgi:hypothetical protein
MENILGEYHWEQTGNTNIKKFYPFPTPIGKQMNSLECMFSCFIGCMHILVLDMVAINVFALAKYLFYKAHHTYCAH